MRHEQMPDDCAQALGVGCDPRVNQRRDDDAGIRCLSGETAFTTDDAKDSGSAFACHLNSSDQVDRYLAFLITATDREDKNCVSVIEARCPEPRRKGGVPSLIIGPCRKF